jgi:hypothetical protein
VLYCAAQLLGAVAGVALASLVLEGAPAHKAVRYAATLPGIHGEAFYVNTIAFVAELAISFVLMSAILFSSNHRVLARLIRTTSPPSWLRYTSPQISLIRHEHESRQDIRPRIESARSLDADSAPCRSSRFCTGSLDKTASRGWLLTLKAVAPRHGFEART